MAVGKIIFGEAAKEAPRAFRSDPSEAWRALGRFSMLFLAVGVVDLALALYPANLGNAEVRFVTLSGTAGGLPILALGAITWLMAMLALKSRTGILAGTVINGVLALAIFIGLSALLDARGAALASAPVQARQLVQGAVIRSSVSSLFFGAAHLLAAVTGWVELRRE